MSRSFKKSTHFSVSGSESEKKDKQIWHKRLRAKTRVEMARIADLERDEHIAPREHDVSNPWDMAKDGRIYMSPREVVAQAAGRALVAAQSAAEKISLRARFQHQMMAK